MVGLDQIRQGLERVATRARIAAGRAVLNLVNDAARRQVLQIEQTFGAVRDGVERYQNYGHYSIPLPGASVAVVALAGSQGHLVAVAVDDPRYRPRIGDPGDSFLYDCRAQMVWLCEGGITITTDRPITVTGTRIEVSATESLHLGGGANGVGVTFRADQVLWHTAGVQTDTVAPLPPADR